MRFDKKIWFRTETEGEYDARTGNYAAPTPVEQEAYADITNTGTDMLTLIYGSVLQNSLTIRTREFFDGSWIRIGDRIYKIDRRRKLQRLTVYIVSEVQ